MTLIFSTKVAAPKFSSVVDAPRLFFGLGPRLRFSKVPENFRAQKTIFSSYVSKNREV